MAYQTSSGQLGALRIKRDESEEYFRSVFENAAIGVVIADANRGYLAVNDRFCAITGYERETLLTMGCHVLVHPDDQAADIAKVERLVRGEATSFSSELRYLHANGATVWVMANVSVIKSGEDEGVRILAMVDDITQRNRPRRLCVRAKNGFVLPNQQAE
jgi:PAS domain S-box-containing protein